MASPPTPAINVGGGISFTGMHDFDSLQELSRSRCGSVYAMRL